MKQLRILSMLAFALVVVLLAAACGGGEDVPEDSIAVVQGQKVTRAEYDAMWERARATYKAQDREVPKTGTAEWTTLKLDIVQYLVQRAQFEEKAKELGIEVTDEEVDAELTKFKKEVFDGSDEKFQAELKKQNVTLEQVKRDIRAKLVQDEIYAKVTGDVKVTDKEVRDYYDKNKSQYGNPVSRTVRHILVEKKARADELYAQLKAGASFAALAKKNSKDPGSAAQGGKLTVSKGQTVPEFDKLAFTMKNNELSEPVKTQYGWHIILAVSDIKPATVTPFEKVKEQIRQQLLEAKKGETMTKWVEDAKKELGDKTAYQVGFAPPADDGTETTDQ
jgi:parvulin-like peptidyl-prolyl isomerase